MGYSAGYSKRSAGYAQMVPWRMHRTHRCRKLTCGVAGRGWSRRTNWVLSRVLKGSARHARLTLMVLVG
jgi:hypothetical protein